jgi:hypothetical protein
MGCPGSNSALAQRLEYGVRSGLVKQQLGTTVRLGR